MAKRLSSDVAYVVEVSFYGPDQVHGAHWRFAADPQPKPSSFHSFEIDESAHVGPIGRARGELRAIAGRAFSGAELATVGAHWAVGTRCATQLTAVGKARAATRGISSCLRIVIIRAWLGVGPVSGAQTVAAQI